MNRIRIGTRKSKLALAQTQLILDEILKYHPHVKVEVVKITTSGDKILDSPLSKVGGKGLFVKEIEEALLRREIDLAIHSMKDLPHQLPDGLSLVAFPKREDPRDALVGKMAWDIQKLPKGSKVGTSSLRRALQLMRLRPDLHIVPLRGNVDTRLRKLDSEGLSAIILAMAGTKRLGIHIPNLVPIPFELMIPAIGQGALALEAREDNEGIKDMLRPLNHKETEIAITTERAFLKAMGGGCQVPVGGICQLWENAIHFKAVLMDDGDKRAFFAEIRGSIGDEKAIGERAAEEILSKGGDQVIKRLLGGTVGGDIWQKMSP